MRENKKLYSVLKFICGCIFKFLYRPKVYGVENIPESGGIIFVSNHKHAFDPVGIMIHTDRMVHYLAKISLFKGIHGKMLESIGIIKVDRSKKNPLAVLEAEEVLNNGGAIGIFPEGTRNRSGEGLLPFKKGAVRMAIETKSLIVPCAIRGNYRIFRSDLEIEYGKAIDVSNMSIEDANDFVKNEVLNLLGK